MKRYLGRADVKSAVHVPNNGKDEEWIECNGIVHQSLENDFSPAPYTLFPFLLKHIPIVLSNGDADLICNWFGVRDMVGNLTWNGKQGMEVV
jgi:carboxypeptidase D